MSFYIVFDNLSSLLEMSQSADLAEDIKKAVADSVEAPFSDVFEAGQVTTSVAADGKILLMVDDLSDDETPPIDYDRGAAALLLQVSAASEVEQKPLTKVGLEISARDVEIEKFYPAFEKLEISLRYRIDHADIFRNRQQLENSESVGKLSEKNLETKDAEQTRQFEKRSQEKRAENLRECLKQKRFAVRFRETDAADLSSRSGK